MKKKAVKSLQTSAQYQRARWEKQQQDYAKALERYRLQQAANKALAYSSLLLAVIAASMVIALASSQ